MKKTILFISAFLLMIPALKADIVIEGRGSIVNSPSDGKLEFVCKNAHMDCIRISGPTCIVNFEDGHQETYFIDGYEIVSVTEEGTDVIIYRQ
jgi:hypothetical protein